MKWFIDILSHWPSPGDNGGWSEARTYGAFTGQDSVPLQRDQAALRSSRGAGDAGSRQNLCQQQGSSSG